MTAFPGSPRTLRGALISLEPEGLLPTVIAFQYNPFTLTRSFAIQGAAAGPEAGQLTGPPKETLRVELVLDATDEREAGRGAAGVAPQLAALQGLVSPRSADALASMAMADAGLIEVLPPPSPVTLFVWGTRRVLPVAVTELAVTEEAHDATLDPTLARVTVGMAVLTYADLPRSHPAHALAVAAHLRRERDAAPALSPSLDAVLGAGVGIG